MKPLSFMFIAGEASGDLLAAELVGALCRRVLRDSSVPTADVQPLRTALVPRFFGAGGSKMAAAGVELAFDLTEHSVIGLSDALRNYFKFRRLFNQLFRLAVENQPDAIICVDFSGFNRRFAHAIRRYIRRHRSEFTPWNPRLVQYVSPQVWASRPGRAYQVARDFDLLLSIFPFEQRWYAQRVPRLRVEYVGHPMADRFAGEPPRIPSARSSGPSPLPPAAPTAPNILLLPGSRADELQRHLPPILGAWERIRARLPKARARMVLPGDMLLPLARAAGTPADLEIQIGRLSQALGTADLAIASTGTVTMECAFFGVPTVALYKTSWSNYAIAKRIVTVKWLTMPNLIAGEEIFPEFIQQAATAENIARAALALLDQPDRCQQIRAKLAGIIDSLDGRGANDRAAGAIVGLINRAPREATSAA